MSNRVGDILNRVARACSVPVPNAWATASQLAQVEIRDDFLRQTVEDIRDRIDLTAPIAKQVEIVGTGAESYKLPLDFHRLQRDVLGVYETTTTRRAGVPVTTDGQWTHLNTVGAAGTFRYFAVEGFPANYTIKFEQDLTTGRNVTVSYISNVWLISQSGVESAEITVDDDAVMLPPDVIEYGCIWRFRERKGLDYQVPLAQYQTRFERLRADSRNIRTVSFSSTAADDYRVMRVPVPDVIPSS